MRFDHVDLEDLVILVSSIPSDSYTLSLSCEGKDLMDSSISGLSVIRYVTIGLIFVSGSLHLFPYVARGSFSEQGTYLGDYQNVIRSHFIATYFCLCLFSFRNSQNSI